MKEAPSRGRDGVTLRKVGGFHDGELSLDAIILCFGKEGDGPSAKEGIGRIVVSDYPVRILRLQILET